MAPIPKANAPKSAMAGGVAIRTDHDRSRADITVFRQDLVADAAFVAADVMEFLDALLGDEFTHLLLVGGCL